MFTDIYFRILFIALVGNVCVSDVINNQNGEVNNKEYSSEMDKIAMGINKIKTEVEKLKSEETHTLITYKDLVKQLNELYNEDKKMVDKYTNDINGKVDVYEKTYSSNNKVFETCEKCWELAKTHNGHSNHSFDINKTNTINVIKRYVSELEPIENSESIEGLAKRIKKIGDEYEDLNNKVKIQIDKFKDILTDLKSQLDKEKIIIDEVNDRNIQHTQPLAEYYKPSLTDSSQTFNQCYESLGISSGSPLAPIISLISLTLILVLFENFNFN